MNYLKAFFFTVIFAFTLNAATAQKTSQKTDKVAAQQRIEQSQKLSVKEPDFKWAYTIALVTDHGGKFDIKFMEGKSKTSEMLARQNMELRKKMEKELETVTSEGDLINLLTELKMELISVVNLPESEGRTMKYYLRTQVAE